MRLHKKLVEILLGKLNNPIETLSAASTLTVGDHLRTFILSSATEFATTLPAPKEGLRIKFIVGAAPSGASYTVVTGSSANIIQGGVSTGEDAQGSVACVSDADTITFVDSKAVAGDWVELVSDGTNWYISGMCLVQDGITTTQAS